MFSFIEFLGIVAFVAVIGIVILAVEYMVRNFCYCCICRLKSRKRREKLGLTGKIESEMAENNIYWRRDYKEFSICYYNLDLNNTEKYLEVFRYDLAFLLEQVRGLKEQYDFSHNERLVELFNRISAFLKRITVVLEKDKNDVAVFAVVRETFQLFPPLLHDFKRIAEKYTEEHIDEEYDDFVEVTSFEMDQIDAILEKYASHALC